MPLFSTLSFQAASAVDGRRRLGATTCNLIKAEVYMEDDSTHDIVGCELPASAVPGEEFKVVEVNFLSDTVVDEIKSGETLLVTTDAILNEETNELIIPAGGSYEVRTIV